MKDNQNQEKAGQAHHRPYLKDTDDQILIVWETAIYDCACRFWPTLTPEQFKEASHALIESHILERDFSIKTMLHIIGSELKKRHGKPLSLEEVTVKEVQRAKSITGPLPFKVSRRFQRRKEAPKQAKGKKP